MRKSRCWEVTTFFLFVIFRKILYIIRKNITFALNFKVFFTLINYAFLKDYNLK